MKVVCDFSEVFVELVVDCLCLIYFGYVLVGIIMIIGVYKILLLKDLF